MPKNIKGINCTVLPTIDANIKYSNLSFLCKSATVNASGIVGINPITAKINNVRCPLSELRCLLRFDRLLLVFLCSKYFFVFSTRRDKRSV